MWEGAGNFKEEDDILRCIVPSVFSRLRRLERGTGDE